MPVRARINRDLLGCLVCQAEVEASSRFCPIHTRAFLSLRTAFAKWTLGYGNLGKDEFLRRIVRLSETGGKTKEIARFLIEDLSRWT